MQPNEPQNPGNPYDFILGGPPAPRQGRSRKKRIIITAAGGGVLLTLIMIVFSLLASSGKGSVETLVSIAQQQNEIVRIAEDGNKKARGATAQNLAITTKLSISSAQKDLLAYAKNQGIKINPDKLAETKDSKTDEQLKSAEQNNRYDETFTKVVTQQLTAYQASLRKAYNETSSQSGKSVLTSASKQIELLIATPTSQPAPGTSPST